MNIQKLSYVFLLCFSVFTFTGCEDDENGGKPQTVGAYGSIPTEALNQMHWKLCGRLLCRWLQLAHHAYVFRG